MPVVRVVRIAALVICCAMAVAAFPAAARATTFATIYSFGAPPDGRSPQGGVTSVDGLLFGTTAGGGTGLGPSAAGCPGLDFAFGSGSGCGTIFTLTPSGAERVFYDFTGLADGANPAASLIAASGALYGTTEFGGSYGNTYDGGDPLIGQVGFGTVFAVSARGGETTLHSFGAPGAFDGAFPVAGLVDVNGTFYGTTSEGGRYGYVGNQYGRGTVFAIGPAGAYRTVHSFGNGTDGSFPESSLVAINGNLYGTTQSGGGGCAAAGCGESCCGTVFELTPAGTETILYRFKGRADGAYPMANLTVVNGTLYGTAQAGGIYRTASGHVGTGGGVVFKIDKPGIESVVHSFGNGTDGFAPTSALLDVNGELYGTTQRGGTSGSGTIFKICRTGAYQVLYDFVGASSPIGNLIDAGGVIYGMTAGAYGAGAVFALKP